MKGARWLTLASLLAAFLFAGCGRPGPPSNRTELILLTPGGNLEDALEPALKRFAREHPEIAVRTISTPGRDYYVKGLSMLAGHAPLDVLWLGMGFGMFAHRDALLDLEPLLAADPAFSLADFYAPVVGWYRKGPRLLGLPYGIDIQAMVCNDSLFADFGLEPPKSDWTVDEMVAAARAMLARQTPEHPVSCGLGMEELRPFLFGLQLLDEETRTFRLNTPAGRAWLEKNVQLAAERVLLRTAGPGELDRLKEFLTLRIPMMEVFTWDLPDLAARASFQWRVLPPPRGPHGGEGAWASSSGFSIARQTKHPEAAWLLLKTLVSEPVQRRLLPGTMPTRLSLFEAYKNQDPKRRAAHEVFVSLLPKLKPDPRIAEQDEVLAEWIYWRETAHQGKRSVAEVLAEAEKRINPILSAGREEKR